MLTAEDLAKIARVRADATNLQPPPMSYRQYLIGCALTGVCADHEVTEPDAVANMAVRIADLVVARLAAERTWSGSAEANNGDAKEDSSD